MENFKKSKRCYKESPIDPDSPEGMALKAAPFIKALTDEGFSNAEVAKYLGIDESGLFRLIAEYPKIRTSVRPDRDRMANILEKVMFQRAIGGGKIRKQVALVVGRGADARVEIVEIFEELPPDPRALMFMLRALKKETYSEIQNLAESNLERVSLIIPRITDNSNIETYEAEPVEDKKDS